MFDIFWRPFRNPPKYSPWPTNWTQPIIWEPLLNRNAFILANMNVRDGFLLYNHFYVVKISLVPVGSAMPMSPERRHEPLGSYRAPPDRPYSVAGQATYHISPERRYDPPYHSSPERRSQQESGYLSSPERRVDHTQSFSGYSPSSSYEDSVYGGSIYGTRSGSVTPVIDEEAR